MGYYDIYKKRVNRYGINYSTRVQGQRESEFENFLIKSVDRVDYLYEEESKPGILQKYKQDETQTLSYLLTRRSLTLPSGTLLSLPRTNESEETDMWLVYYLERAQSKGYNKYVMIKMSHYVRWVDKTGGDQSSWAYLRGAGNKALSDSVESGGIDAIYAEDSNSNFLIMPRNINIKKENYVSIGEEPFVSNYKVTGFETQAIEGVEYVTLDPVFEYDTSPAPVKQPDDDEEDFYWLNGGVE